VAEAAIFYNRQGIAAASGGRPQGTSQAWAAGNLLVAAPWAAWGAHICGRGGLRAELGHWAGLVKTLGKDGALGGAIGGQRVRPQVVKGLSPTGGSLGEPGGPWVSAQPRDLLVRRVLVAGAEPAAPFGRGLPAPLCPRAEPLMARLGGWVRAGLRASPSSSFFFVGGRQGGAIAPSLSYTLGTDPRISP
jgi:hypothetical protein